MAVICQRRRNFEKQKKKEPEETKTADFFQTVFSDTWDIAGDTWDIFWSYGDAADKFRNKKNDSGYAGDRK